MFVKLTGGLSQWQRGTGDSPRELFWDGAPNKAPQYEAQEPNMKVRGVSCLAHGGYQVNGLPGCGDSDVGITSKESFY